MRPRPSTPRPEGERTPRNEAWAVALAALLLGVVWALAVPPFMGPDEPWHLEYASHVADGQVPRGDAGDYGPELDRLPLSAAQVAARFPGATAAEVARRQRALLEALDRERWWARVDWAEDPGAPVSFDLVHPGITAAGQPPLQALLTGLLLRPFRSADPALQVRIARLPSVLALVLLALAALHAGRALGGERAGRMAAAVALAAPPATRMASTAGNDAVATAVVAGATWAAVALGRGGGARALATFGLCLALAPFAKTTALPAFALLLVLPLAGVARRGHDPRAGVPPTLGPAERRRRPLALALGAVLLVGGAALGLALLARSPAVPADLTAALERAGRGLSAETWRPVFGNLVGSSNWDSRPAPAELATLPLGLAVGALLGGVLRARGRPSVDRALASLLALLVLVQVAAVVARGVGSARYLMPAWPALAALLGLGWARLPRGRNGDPTWALLVLLLVTWNACALFGGVLVEERSLLGD